MTAFQRAVVTAEAATWLRTPYHHMGRVKGGGTDCLMLLAGVYEAAGVIPHIEVPFYPPDWHLHRSVERYLDGLMQYAREVKGAAFTRRCRVVQVWSMLRTWRNRRRMA